jgi:hypothetical protein
MMVAPDRVEQFTRNGSLCAMAIRCLLGHRFGTGLSEISFSLYSLVFALRSELVRTGGWNC